MVPITTKFNFLISFFPLLISLSLKIIVLSSKGSSYYHLIKCVHYFVLIISVMDSNFTYNGRDFRVLNMQMLRPIIFLTTI